MNKLVFAFVSVSSLLATMSLAACSSDSSDDDGDDDDTTSSSSSGGSSGATSSSSSGGSTSSSSSGGSSSSSGGTATLNGCTTFVDHTADTAVEIEWVNPTNDADKCSKVKAGTVVTWKGDMVAHPLTTKGGTTPTPITLINSGEDATVTFDAAGDFGFVCTKHSNMTGVIQVVP